jgi:murein DD-endopeptidase MepM/ murein hydrolase activator NlpD
MKLFFLILLLLATDGFAKKLYKYQDPQGNWHFTDKKPEEGQKFESRQLKSEPKRHVWLERSGEKSKPEYYIRNTYHAPIEVEVKFTEYENVYAKPELPNRFVVEPGESSTLFQVAGINEFKSWKFKLEYRYTIGSPLAEHQADTIYVPPIAANGRFQISQGFGGKFSHTNEQNQYAVDIVMPVGTPVHAAREGVVMDVENDYFQSGTKKAYKSRANSIRILHEDGSMAIYAHLALEKAQVYAGLKVWAGQLIGYSGNTGFSTGPHLHFAVQVNQGMKLASVPFKFIDETGQLFVPQSGKWLQGVVADSI